MGDYCLERQWQDKDTQSIPGVKWCGQVVTLKENGLSIPNGRELCGIADGHSRHRAMRDHCLEEQGWDKDTGSFPADLK